MAKEGMTKEANTDRTATMETKTVIMQGKEATLITKEAIIMIKEETRTENQEYPAMQIMGMAR
eukprot:10024604-Ditylum_brightwellii.AAC.1